MRLNAASTLVAATEGVPPRAHSEFLRFEQFVQVANAAVGLGVRKIRLTGGSPW